MKSGAGLHPVPSDQHFICSKDMHGLCVELGIEARHGLCVQLGIEARLVFFFCSHEASIVKFCLLFSQPSIFVLFIAAT
jgi:hypothetical protein